MNLKFPDTNIDFIVTPAYFLGDFDIYDREESLGEYLNQFNPNDRNQLAFLLKEKFFNGGRVSRLTMQHKAELMKMLAQSLEDENYNFQKFVAHDREPDDYFTLPWDWEFYRPRFFFEEVYKLAIELWGADLKQIGVMLPEFDKIDLADK